MEIVLSEKQRTLIEAAFKEQQTLQQQAQQEFSKIQKRIDDAVLLILDAKGIDIVPGIQYNEGKLTVPEAEVEKPSDSQPVMEVNKEEAKSE